MQLLLLLDPYLGTKNYLQLSSCHKNMNNFFGEIQNYGVLCDYLFQYIRIIRVYTNRYTIQIYFRENNPYFQVLCKQNLLLPNGCTIKHRFSYSRLRPNFKTIHFLQTHKIQIWFRLLMRFLSSPRITGLSVRQVFLHFFKSLLSTRVFYFFFLCV